MDIDIDFQTSKRDEVIEYLLQKYNGHAAQIASYGLYKIDNLINDLAKVCGLPTDKTIEPEIRDINIKEIKEMKRIIKSCEDDGKIDFCMLKRTGDYVYYNSNYDNILLHFERLYNKVRYIGTHAAGVVLTKEPISNYTALRLKDGKLFAAYDLNDFETLGIIKFDMLGLKTMEILSELRKRTKTPPMDEKGVEDKKLLDAFYEGKTTGIFQMEKQAPKDILHHIQCDCFNDVIAVNAMNRPGPLQLKMPQQYAENKQCVDLVKDTLVYPYTKNTYGTIVYQEQLQQICINIGGLDWAAADKIMKTDRTGTAADIRRYHECFDAYEKPFITNAIKNGMDKTEAEQVFDSLFNYQFNAGHATAYALISMEEMYYKVYHPLLYWLVKLKYEDVDIRRLMFESEYVKSGYILLPPTMNAKERYSLKKFDGEVCIQQGLTSIKGLGIKAAQAIVATGPYEDFAEFDEKIDKRVVNKNIVKIMQDNHCFESNRKMMLNYIVYVNKLLYSKNIRA